VGAQDAPGVGARSAVLERIRAALQGEMDDAQPVPRGYRHAGTGADTGTGSHAGLDPRADAGTPAGTGARSDAGPDADQGARPRADPAAAARARPVAAAVAAATPGLPWPRPALSLVTLVVVTAGSPTSRPCHQFVRIPYDPGSPGQREVMVD